MLEDTQAPEPQSLETPQGGSPEDKSQHDDFDAVSAQMNAEAAQRARQEVGEEGYIAIQKQVRAEIVKEFSEADKRDYKDLDGVRKTFTERNSAYEAKVAAEKRLAEIENTEENGGAEAPVGKKSEKPPVQKQEEPQAPNGGVDPTINALAVREIVRTNPEFIHVQKKVEKVAEAQGVSVLDVWENEGGDFDVYDFKGQASFAESKIRADEASNKRKQALPSSGVRNPGNKATITQDQLAKKAENLSAEEIDRMVDEGRVV